MNYKLSYYTVITDAVNEKGHRIIFCTRTGKSLTIPQICLDYIQEGLIDEIPKSIFDKLVANQAIVDAEEDELKTIIQENKDYIAGDSSTQLYEVIQPSAMCQLGCYYCGQQHTKDYLSNDLSQKLIERIRHKAATGQYKSMYIGWFGAEPLMGLRQMRELTIEFKKIAAEYNLGYGAKVVTNGLSLKPAIFEELAKEMSVNQIEVTLDGIAEFHDEHRFTKEGGKSFDLIFSNLKKILLNDDYFSFNCGISIRCNVDEKNPEGVEPLIRLLAKEGMHKRISYFYATGIYAWGNEAHKKSLTKEEFAQQEVEWLKLMYKLGYKINLAPGRSKQVCMSVSKGAEMVDAFGNVFNCTEVSYVPSYEGTDYIMGNLKDDIDLLVKPNKLTTWNDTLLTDTFPCHTCKMLPVCGGGCPKSWHEDMRACPPSKFNIKDKLMLRYAISQISNVNEIDDKFEEVKRMKELVLA
jgi:uncharacterized protein